MPVPGGSQAPGGSIVRPAGMVGGQVGWRRGGKTHCASWKRKPIGGGLSHSGASVSTTAGTRPSRRWQKRALQTNNSTPLADARGSMLSAVLYGTATVRESGVFLPELVGHDTRSHHDGALQPPIQPNGKELRPNPSRCVIGFSGSSAKANAAQ